MCGGQDESRPAQGHDLFLVESTDDGFGKSRSKRPSVKICCDENPFAWTTLPTMIDFQTSLITKTKRNTTMKKILALAVAATAVSVQPALAY
jgi:hypothetical protein